MALTRKEFMGALGKIAGATAFSSPLELIAQKPESRESHFLNDPPQLIDKVAIEILGPEVYNYVNRFHWDETGFKSTEALRAVLVQSARNEGYNNVIADLIDNNPELVVKAIEDYYEDSRFAKWSGLKRSQKILEYLETPEGRVSLMQKLIELRRNYSSYIAYACTVNDPLNIGQKEKSDVFVFEGALEPTIEISISGINFKMRNSRQILATLLAHEFKHAEIHYNGIELGEGKRIDHHNFTSIDLMVSTFVEERQADKYAVEVSRMFAPTNDGLLPNYSDAFVFSLTTADALWRKRIRDIKQKIDERKMDERSRTLLDRQLELLKPLAAEAARIGDEVIMYALAKR